MFSSILSHARHNLVAYLALFVALGGTSYAAINLPAKSVGTKQLRAGSVKSSAVKDRSLLARDFKAGQLPPGAQGLPGSTGATGPVGSNGANGATAPPTSRCARPVRAARRPGVVNCLPGERATGGGYGVASASSLRFTSSTPCT